MAKSGSNDAFDKSRLDLKEYSGIEVGTKDVERMNVPKFWHKIYLYERRKIYL